MFWIWAKTLGLDQEEIGVFADFFELGGHSLRYIRMIKLVNDRYKSDLTAGAMFKLPHIAAIAEFLSKREQKSELQWIMQ